MSIRKEEYTTLGDFIKMSFERDFDAIRARYPKLNDDYLNLFSVKLQEIKSLESGVVLTQEQKSATTSLITEASELSKKLNFLIDYMEDAGMETGIITTLKRNLMDDDIEAAVSKIEDVSQLINSSKAALTEEGMEENFGETLQAHKASLAKKNALQNSSMNSRKQLTQVNDAQYKELYAFISKIARSGKNVFDGTVTEDEYTISKIISRMRAAKGLDKQ